MKLDFVHGYGIFVQIWMMKPRRYGYGLASSFGVWTEVSLPMSIEIRGRDNRCSIYIFKSCPH